jgi:hypothetical protein
MHFRREVAFASLVVTLFVGGAVSAAEPVQPKVKTEVAGGCPDYCGDTKCSTISHSVVCSDPDDHSYLYWDTCASISSYYQAGTKCCTTRTRCCTYWDRNDKPLTRWEDSGETIGCG